MDYQSILESCHNDTILACRICEELNIPTPRVGLSAGYSKAKDKLYRRAQNGRDTEANVLGMLEQISNYFDMIDFFPAFYINLSDNDKGKAIPTLLKRVKTFEEKIVLYELVYKTAAGNNLLNDLVSTGTFDNWCWVYTHHKPITFCNLEKIAIENMARILKVSNGVSV
jgi:hypothetical protein